MYQTMWNTYKLEQFPELYLDWVNNFLTVERFAEYYGIKTHAGELAVS